MASTLDIDRLREYLRAYRADPALLAWVEAELAAVDVLAEPRGATPPAELPFHDLEILLAGLLDQVAERGRDIARKPVQAFFELGEHLGLETEWIDALVHEQVGRSGEALRALSVLGLPLDATAAQVKAAHRQLAKLYHPDRVTHLAAEFEELARTRTAELNHARKVLLDTADQLDDVELEPVDDEGEGAELELDPLEDAPTELASEHDPDR